MDLKNFDIKSVLDKAKSIDFKKLIPGSSKSGKVQKPDKLGFYTVITIDPTEAVIRFSSMTDVQQASFTVDTKKCNTRLFDEEFFAVFGKLINEYALQHPSAQSAGVTLVLPDMGVATDILNIPTLRKKMNLESLDVAINDLYRNSSELKINKALILQNKQYSSYYLSIMQSSLLVTFYSAMAESKMVPQAVTFASNAAVNAVQSLIPKLHNATYMLMDIKSGSTRIVFVSKGVTCGFYSLPFGYSILGRNTLAAEDMLMEHSLAEYVVANAKAKAKAKQTMMNMEENAKAMAEAIAENEDQNISEEDISLNSDGADDDFEEEDEENKTEDIFTSGMAASETTELIKGMPKKQPRKLPKFMLRPAPHTEEEYTYENFRLFVKWALNLIAANKSKFWHDNPDAVYVNLPAEFHYVFDMVNEEHEENGVSFMPLELGNTSEKIINNLESYGGFFTSQYNDVNNF